MPRREAVDRLIREMPQKMKEALVEQLDAPKGLSHHASDWFQESTEYVDFYRPILRDDGSRWWDREGCAQGDGVYTDDAGVHGFCLGIVFESEDSPWFATFVTYSIEEFDERSAKLSIKNLDGDIPITDANDPNCYAHAARTSVDRLIDSLSLKTRKIGFIDFVKGEPSKGYR
jgi:hypothetical protein